MKKQIASVGMAFALAACAVAQQEEAQRILRETGVTGGLVVHVGCGDSSTGSGQAGGLTMALRAGDAFVVQGLDADVSAAQDRIHAAGVSGPVSVASWSGGALPYPDNLVRLIVVSDPRSPVASNELFRVLAPGGVAWVAGRKIMKPWPAALDGWTHYLGDASGNAVSRDSVVGPPKAMQWFAGPITERSHNWVNSTDAFVSSGGKVFYIHDEGPAAVEAQKAVGMNWASTAKAAPVLPERWALIARDAFSGVLLWKRPLTGFGQYAFEEVGASQPTLWNIWSGPLQLHRRVVAGNSLVYVTLAYRGGMSALDANTGRTVWELTPQGFVDEFVLDADRLFLRVRGSIPAKLDKPIGMPAEPGKPLGGRYSSEKFTEYVDSQPPEQLVAVDAATGKELWTADAPRITTESLCALGGKVCYFDMTNVVCREAGTGKELWRSPQTKLNTARGGTYARSGSAGNLFLWQDKVFFNAKGTVCLSLADGKELWRQPRLGFSAGFGHPTGLRVIGGVLYTDNGARYDANTGSDLGPLTTETALGGSHGRCHRGIATTNYLCGIRFGIEFYDIAARKMVSDDRWLRSACSLGYIPANGFLYHTPDPCSCWMGPRIRGFHAFASVLPALDYATVDEAARLEKGPSYAKASEGKPAYAERGTGNAERGTSTPPRSEFRVPSSSDWPVYRHDIARSGRATTTLATNLVVKWTADIGGPGEASVLTPPVIAGGRIFVSRRDANEVVCLDASSGKVLWRFATASFVDSAPTVADGRLVFGCADGRVYCLDAADGALAWRFRAAPGEMWIVDDGRMASKWPVHGAVAVKDGTVYATAGRSSFLDGGIQVFKLELATGKMLGHARLNGPWYGLLQASAIPAAGEATGKKDATPREGTAGGDVEGARSDLLVYDGTDFHMGSTRITPALQTFSTPRLNAEGKPTGGYRLRPIGGFLDDTYFHRVGWHYSDKYYGGGNAAGAANAGKILVFDDTHTYASQHEGKDMGRYPNHLFGGGSTLNVDPIGASNEHKGGFDVIRKDKPLWSVDVPQIVRAMLLAPAALPEQGQVLFIAGPPAKGADKDPLAPYEYRTPGSLWAVSAKDGRKLAEWTLSACPVFDGLAAADRQLFVSQVNGKVTCLSAAR